MHSNVNSSRALKGYLRLSMVAYRRPVILFFSILLGLITFSLVVSGLLATYSTGTGQSNGGALTGGFIGAAITLMIIGFSSCSNKEMARVFAFPMSRKILSLGNLVTIVGVSFVFSYIMGVIGGLEALLGRAMAHFVPGLSFTSYVTLADYALGFWLTASYLVLMMSSAYAVGMYFHRYKIPTIGVIGLVFISLIVFPANWTYVSKVFTYFIFEQNALLLSLKIWITALILHALAFIPMIRMEVKS